MSKDKQEGIKPNEFMNTIDPYPEKLMAEALSKYSTPYGKPNPETYAYLAGASAMNGSAGVPSSILRMNDTWPLSDVLKHLIEGTQILLEKKNYDGPTYEQMEICVKVGNEIRELLSQSSPSPQTTNNALMEPKYISPDPTTYAKVSAAKEPYIPSAASPSPLEAETADKKVKTKTIIK